MRVLRWIAVSLGAVIALAFAVGLGARFADGPLGPFPGGALRAGELAAGPVDWASLGDLREIELQLEQPPRSRTTWLVVHEGKAYVPCGAPTLSLLKQWPHELAADDRVVARIAGRRHQLRAVRVRDRAEWDGVAAASGSKYGHGQAAYPDDIWYFRLEPRS